MGCIPLRQTMVGLAPVLDVPSSAGQDHEGTGVRVRHPPHHCQLASHRAGRAHPSPRTRPRTDSRSPPALRARLVLRAAGRQVRRQRRHGAHPPPPGRDIDQAPTRRATEPERTAPGRRGVIRTVHGVGTGSGIRHESAPMDLARSPVRCGPDGGTASSFCMSPGVRVGEVCWSEAVAGLSTLPVGQGVWSTKLVRWERNAGFWSPLWLSACHWGWGAAATTAGAGRSRSREMPRSSPCGWVATGRPRGTARDGIRSGRWSATPTKAGPRPSMPHSADRAEPRRCTCWPAGTGTEAGISCPAPMAATSMTSR